MKKRERKPNKVIYYVEICDDDTGEVAGFCDAKGKLLHWWALNDASWRGEYLDPLLDELGYTVRYDCPDSMEKTLRDAVVELYGVSSSDEEEEYEEEEYVPPPPPPKPKPIHIKKGMFVYLKVSGYGMVTYEEAEVAKVRNGAVYIVDGEQTFDFNTGAGSFGNTGGLRIDLCVLPHEIERARQFMLDNP